MAWNTACHGNAARRRRDNNIAVQQTVCVYVYVYKLYMYVCVYVYIYIWLVSGSNMICYIYVLIYYKMDQSEMEEALFGRV